MQEFFLEKHSFTPKQTNFESMLFSLILFGVSLIFCVDFGHFFEAAAVKGNLTVSPLDHDKKAWWL